MKIEDYQLLVALNQIGTVRGAARELLISQPALSQRLKQIEEQWGKQIFVRSHKKLLLTPAGEEILSFAEKIIQEEEKVKEKVEAMSDQIAGTLSLGVSSVIGQYVLPSILESFIETYPNVKVELQTGLSEMFRTTYEHYHLCIVRGEKIPHLNGYELFSDNLYLVEKKKEGSIHHEKPLIEFQSDPTFHSTVNEWFINHSSSFSFSRKIKVDQIETCKQLMSKGLGMAVLPEIAIRDLKREEYHFIPLMINKKQLSRKTWVCFTEDARKLPQVQAFLEIVERQKNL
ncbi:MAG: LysR family transcriptional regulator [Bacillaceae bacterium]|nr:LysR family transcriptional regulator [Bacillaceae bacterium]